MPLNVALTCAKCGAYLPDIRRGATSLTCPACGTVTTVEFGDEEAALFNGGIAVESAQGDGFLIAGPGRTAVALADKLAPFLTAADHQGTVGKMLAIENAHRMSTTYLADLMKQEHERGLALRERRADALLHRRNWLIAAAVTLALALWYGLWLAALAVAVGAVFLWLHFDGVLTRTKADEDALARNVTASKEVVWAQIKQMDADLAKLRGQDAPRQ